VIAFGDVASALDLHRISYSNLGGHGPDLGGPHGIRYHNVAISGGNSVDMVVTAVSEYHADNARINGQRLDSHLVEGLARAFGAVNLQAETSVELSVDFYKSGTNASVKMERFYFSVFDVDEGRHCKTEEFAVGGFSHVYLTNSSRLAVQRSGEGALFRSSGGEVPRPISPALLTVEQRDHAATFVFEGTSGFPLKARCAAAADKHSTGGWTFVFGSASNAYSYATLVPAATIAYGGEHWLRSADWRQLIGPHDCRAGFANWRAGWSDMKKLWCCHNAGVACVEASTTQATTSTTAAPTTTTTEETTSTSTSPPFQCLDGFDSQMWSPKKMEWCCAHDPKHCPHDKDGAGVSPSTKTEEATMTSATTSTTKATTSTKEATTSTTAAHDSANASATEAHDCDKDVAHAETAWSLPKRQWCCKHKSVGCPLAPSSEFNCHDDLARWKETWTFKKKSWCCKERSLGCYDCRSDEKSWASDHKDFCCKTTGAGCHAAPEPAKSNASKPYDCIAGLADWKVGWGFEKKQWCCKHEALGCYDCGGPSADWPGHKREWCCRAAQLGCGGAPTEAIAAEEPTPTPAPAPTPGGQPPVPMFNCEEQLESWKVDWSLDKKLWCCEDQAYGCYDCTSSPNAWPVPQAQFCCAKHGIACPMPATTAPVAPAVPAAPAMMSKPYDCQAGLANWEMGWSGFKKDWCCQNEALGCIAGSIMPYKFQRKFDGLAPQPSSRSRLTKAVVVSLLGAVSLAAVLNFVRSCSASGGSSEAPYTAPTYSNLEMLESNPEDWGGP